MTAKHNCFSSTPVCSPHMHVKCERRVRDGGRDGAERKETRGAHKLEQCFPLCVFMLYDRSQAADKRAQLCAPCPSPVTTSSPNSELLHVKYQAD